MKISRRYALKSFLSLISYISLSKVSFGNNQILTQKDVIVIGAGISGLVAASTLIQKGANVIILEAKNYTLEEELEPTEVLVYLLNMEQVGYTDLQKITL